MSEEEIKSIFDSIPKVENNNCISAYGSIDTEDIKSAIKRLNKIPDYNDLLKENKELKDNWNKLKEYLNQMLEHSSKYITYDSNNKIDDILKCVVEERKSILDKMKELEGDK